MRQLPFVLMPLVFVFAAGPVVAPVAAQKQEPKITVPDAGVPQIMTMDGRYVRAAYNNEGYTILGYRLANMSIGEEWMLLEVGVALRESSPDYTLKRGDVSLTVPDGTTVPLPSVAEFRHLDTSALKARERVQRDSINYFPPNAYQSCAIQFFPDLDQNVMPFDDVGLTNHRACVGRFYFKVPGGIKYGQHYLNVKFAESTVRVPFRILTKDEEKELNKHYNDIKKQVDEAFRPKK
jgi:hypothetical protein